MHLEIETDEELTSGRCRLILVLRNYFCKWVCSEYYAVNMIISSRRNVINKYDNLNEEIYEYIPMNPLVTEPCQCYSGRAMGLNCSTRNVTPNARVW